MSKHDPNISLRTKRSFKAASLKIDPSLIAVACYLAQTAAEADYKSLSLGETAGYNAPDKKGGPV